MRSKRKSLTINQQKAKDDHDKWLRKRGVHPDQLRAVLPHNAKGKRLGVHALPDYKAHQGERTVQTSDRVVGSTAKKEPNVYTGTLIKGIATMHKSNAVPVIDQKQAEEISKMGR